MAAPACGDLGNGQIPEVVVSSGDGFVHAYNGNGSQIWAKQLLYVNGQAHNAPAASPIIADFNGDGINDVAAGNDYAFFMLNGRNGAIMQINNTFVSHESAGAVGDFGGSWQLIVDGFNTPNHTNRLRRSTCRRRARRRRGPSSGATRASRRPGRVQPAAAG